MEPSDWSGQELSEAELEEQFAWETSGWTRYELDPPAIGELEL